MSSFGVLALNDCGEPSAAVAYLRTGQTPRRSATDVRSQGWNAALRRPTSNKVVIDRAALVASFVAPATYGALFVPHTWINELIKGRRALPPIETLSAILTTIIIFTIFGFFLVAPFTVYVGVPIASLARRRQIASPIFYGSAGAFTGAIFACLYLVINGLSLVPSSLQGLLEFLKVVTAGVAGGIAYWSIAVPSSDIPEAKLS